MANWKWLENWLFEGGYDLNPLEFTQIRGVWSRLTKIYEIPPRGPVPHYAQIALQTALAHIKGNQSFSAARGQWESQQEALRYTWAATQGVVLAALEDERPQAQIARRLGLNRETVRRMATNAPHYRGSPNPQLIEERRRQLWRSPIDTHKSRGETY